MTDEDTDRINAAATRFCHRHADELAILAAGVTTWRELHEIDGENALQALGYALDHEQGESGRGADLRRYLNPLWLRAFRRAVRDNSADSTAYGYLGVSVK
jgi:hypothetical protein